MHFFRTERIISLLSLSVEEFLAQFSLLLSRNLFLENILWGCFSRIYENKFRCANVTKNNLKLITIRRDNKNISRALSVLFVVGQITNCDCRTTSDARNIYDWPDHRTTQVVRMARRLRELVYVFGPKFSNVNRRLRS